MSKKFKIVSIIVVVATLFIAITPVYADDGTETPPKRGESKMLETLGLTKEEFDAMRESGMTIQEICEAQGCECSFEGKGHGAKKRNDHLLETLGLTKEEFDAMR